MTPSHSLACMICAFEDGEFLSVLRIATAILGVHLVDPYLSVAPTFKHKNMISVMLYKDLKTTNVRDLLDISRPTFKFVDDERLSSAA